MSRTRVIEVSGRVLCKLDLGSHGPGGLVVEGVFTFPEARGRGLATGLVATVVARDSLPPLGRYGVAALAATGASLSLVAAAQAP